MSLFHRDLGLKRLPLKMSVKQSAQCKIQTLKTVAES